MPETCQEKNAYLNPLLVGVILLFAGIACGCVMYKPSTIMTSLAPQFALSGNAVTLIMSIFTLVGIVCAVPAGGAVRKLGFKRILTWSAALILAGSALGLLAGGKGAILVASRAVEGVGLAFLTTAAPVAIQQCVAPEKQGMVTGLWGCWAPAGSLIANVLTPIIYGWGGFSAVWIVYGCVVACALALMVIFLKAPEAEAVGVPAAEAASGNGTARYKDFLKKDYIFYLLVFALTCMFVVTLMGILPTALQQPPRGMSMQAAGLSATVISALSLISSPVFGVIADKIGRTKILLVVNCIAVMIGTFIAFTQTGWLFWFGVVLTGIIGMGLSGIIISGWMGLIPSPELVPVGMGLLILFQQTGSFCGTAVTPLLLGPALNDFTTAGIAFLVLGVVQLVLLISVKRLK